MEPCTVQTGSHLPTAAESSDRVVEATPTVGASRTVVFVVQVSEGCGDGRRWRDHIVDHGAGEVPLTFTTREEAERYVTAVVTDGYAVEFQRWVQWRIRRLEEHARYLQARYRLDPFGTLGSADEIAAGKVVGCGPEPEPGSCGDRWRVVTRFDRAARRFDESSAGAMMLWCESCRGRVGIDVDCDDVDHVHREVPYRRRRSPITHV